MRNEREGDIFVFFKFVKPITAVYFPESENAYVNGVLRAAERTAHTKHAVMPERKYSVFVFYIVLRAYVYAAHAVYAFFGIYMECGSVQVCEFLFQKAHGRAVKCFIKGLVYVFPFIFKQFAAMHVC